MIKIPINLKDNNYKIFIEEDIFKQVIKFHKKNFLGCKPFIITDKNLKNSYLKKLVNKFNQEKISVEKFIIMPGETSKSFKTFEKLSNAIIKKKINRNDIIYALGGGVVGDLSGFLASVILRGIKLIQIPTTLLSQVDSSVGGKTAINTDNGKNLVGTFYQPQAVFIDPKTLQTLSKKEFLAGYAEVIKYGLIDDKNFFKWLDKNIENILKLDLNVLKKIISICCKKKAKFVKLDEKETKSRMLLNLGHTFAHSIETELKYKVRHGEAVSIGLLMAMKLSSYFNYTSNKDFALLEKHLYKCNLPTKLKHLSAKKKWSVNNLVRNMYLDKKVLKGKLRFILCKGIGKSFVKDDVKKNILNDIIKEFIN